MTSRKRKRVSPRDEFTRFCDAASKHGWDVLVFRYIDEDEPERVFLKALAVRGGREVSAPSVSDVKDLARSVTGLREQLEREAA